MSCGLQHNLCIHESATITNEQGAVPWQEINKQDWKGGPKVFFTPHHE
jgi:hypothetical protein